MLKLHGNVVMLVAEWIDYRGRYAYNLASG